MSLLEYRNIYWKPEKTELYNGFSFILKQNQKYYLKGKSGSGKSSLLKMALGFITPDRGEILWNKTPVSAVNIGQIRRKIAFVPQSPDLGEGTVENWISNIFALKNNLSLKPDKNTLLHQIELFKLTEEILFKKLENISGGEKQRLALMISLFLKRDLYLLDEPTASIDKEMKEVVVDIFNRIKNITLFVVSHDNSWDAADSLQAVNINSRETK